MVIEQEPKNMIRKKMITRDQAIEEVKKFEGKFPQSYLGKDIIDILNNIGLSKEEFLKFCNKYTNKKIFKCNQAGDLIINEDGSPVKNFDYN